MCLTDCICTLAFFSWGKYRRTAWIEERHKDTVHSKGGNNNKGGQAGRPGRAADPLDVCLDVLEGFAKAGDQKAEEAMMAKALEEVQRLKARSIKEVRDPVLKVLAPRCTHHQQTCRLLKVKKSGPNKGRRFYSCSFPRG